MSKKILWIDLECTGTNSILNGILQISAIVDIDGEIKERFNSYVQPYPDDKIDEEALKIIGIEPEKISEFREPLEVQKDLISVMNKYVNRFDRNDGFTLGVYNHPFDYNFLVEWFRKHRGDDSRVFDFFDEMINGGYRTGDPFDQVNQWYRKEGWNFFASYCNKKIDVLNLVVMYYHLKGEDYKKIWLAEVCSDFGIDIDAHDSSSDVNATRELFYKLKDRMVIK